MLKYSYAKADNTGVAHDNIDGILENNKQEELSEMIKAHGSIGSQPEWAVPPQDNFSGITKELANTINDMSMGSGSALKLLRPAIGKVVTNLVRPVSYSVRQKFDVIKDAFLRKSGPVRGHPSSGKVKAKNPLTGLRGLLKTIVDDTPIYRDYGAPPIGREVPYRAMFDLKPRYGKEAYSNIDDLIKQNKSGSFDIVNEISFNPKSVIGNRNLRNVVEEVEFPKQPGKRSHETLGDFIAKRRRDSPTGEVTGLDFEDVWDVGFRGSKDKFNMKDWVQWAKAARKVKKKYGVYPKAAGDEAGSQIMRTLAESITNPVTIKGTVPKSIYDDVVKELGTKLTDDDMLKVLQKITRKK